MSPTPTTTAVSTIALLYQSPTGMVAVDEVTEKELAGPAAPAEVLAALRSAGYTAAYEFDVETGETIGGNWLEAP